MASKPSDSSAKVFSVQPQEVATFYRVHLWEEYGTVLLVEYLFNLDYLASQVYFHLCHMIIYSGILNTRPVW